MKKFNSNRLKKLAGILTERIATYEELHNWDNPGYNGSTEFNLPGPREELDLTKEMLVKYPAWLRAVHLWFHGAHHVTRGTGFAGDHAELYDRIYTEVQDEIDGAVEKIVGVTNDHHLACPHRLTEFAIEIMNRYDSPSSIEADQIPVVGCQMIKDYLDYLQNTADSLERGGKLTMGLNDALYSSANTHETYVYLLQQRSKPGL